MPIFVSTRDFDFFQHINREVVSELVDIEIILYKIVADAANVNIYGEAVDKPTYRGISLSALVKYPKKIAETEDGFGYNVQQKDVEFRFVRKLLEDVSVYPEVGDVIKYNNNFYSINNVNEAQLIAGQPNYNQTILCECHLTRRSTFNIEETHT